MRRALTILAATVLLTAAGCASKPKATPQPTTIASEPTTQPARDPKADLALDDIEPRPVMPSTRPTTHASDDAPLESLELFASARDQLLQGQRQSAIRLLEQAVKLDAESYEMWFALGQAYAGVGAASEKSIAAFEKAAAIDPGRLELQTDLGRQYLAKNDLPRATEHLRLALQTKKYSQDDDAAAIADFYLAKALQQAGYDRAALESYSRLLDRLQRPIVSLRGVPELVMVVNQPDKLFIQVGELYEKRGELDDAIRAYEMAAARRPDRNEYAARVVRTMLKAGHQKEAADRAADAVRDMRASSDSLALLNEAYKDAGGDAAVVEALTRLRQENPDDHTFLFALADTLVAQQRIPEAEQLFGEAAAQSNYDFDIVRRAVTLQADHENSAGGAKLLIEASARKPESLHELRPLWQELIRPSRKSHIRLNAVQALEVSPDAQASKLFWVAWIAQIWSRDAVTRNSLEQAVKLSPPFAPAYRQLLGRIWLREDWDVPKKLAASQAMIDSAQSQGDEILAAELRGLTFLNQKLPVKAVDHFARAVRLGGKSPDLQIEYAGTLLNTGNNARAEQILWKLIGDQPMCEDAYASLFKYYMDGNAGMQARKVLSAWRKADPDSVNAKLYESFVRSQIGQGAAAEEILNDLFQHDADNADVLNHLAAYYARQGKLDTWLGKLEAEIKKHPENRVAVEQLVDIYTAQKKTTEADRVLASARSAVADDPDLLYYVAGLYSRVGQKETNEKILQEVLVLDPLHAPASNDLGYNWADQGKNLERAEQLIRVALQGEPDNGAFLDSLGWVLYKRGKFPEATKYFREATEPASFPDPVVLDHLGDSLYRMGERSEAARVWKKSWDRVGQLPPNNRPDVELLRTQLQDKIKAAEAGQPVNVAPTVETPAKQQAKN